MTGPRGPIVIDTDVYSADLSETALIAVYEPIIVGRPAFLSFQTVAELHFGALRRNWGAARMRSSTPRSPPRRSSTLARISSLPTLTCVRSASVSVTHSGNASTIADRWIAATALRLGIPLVSNDRIFEGAPGLRLESARS